MSKEPEKNIEDSRSSFADKIVGRPYYIGTPPHEVTGAVIIAPDHVTTTLEGKDKIIIELYRALKIAQRNTSIFTSGSAKRIISDPLERYKAVEL